MSHFLLPANPILYAFTRKKKKNPLVVFANFHGVKYSQHSRFKPINNCSGIPKYLTICSYSTVSSHQPVQTSSHTSLGPIILPLGPVKGWP